jgi:Flp pilus assembly protein TadD
MFRFMLAASAVALGLGGCQTPTPTPAPVAPAPAPVVADAPPPPARPVPEATSLLGRSLYPPPLAPDSLARRGAELAQAAADFRQDPLDEHNIIWLGRRLAAVGRFRQAIAVYSDGLILHPDSFRLLRHRGHRYITTRRFDEAINDLSRAADLIADVPDETEPDSRPNARNSPRSTTHTNIYYHLGLARYLRGEFQPALEAYQRCLELAANDDMTCATLYWLYLTLRRLGRDDEAARILEPVSADMDIIENTAYHKLLLLYRGKLTLPQVLEGADGPGPEAAAIDDATLGYGIGAWHLLNGDLDRAYALFQTIVEGGAWPAFGHIAAEAELDRWIVRAETHLPAPGPNGAASRPGEQTGPASRFSLNGSRPGNVRLPTA